MGPRLARIGGASVSWNDSPPREGGHAFVYRARVSPWGAVAIKVAKPREDATEALVAETKALVDIHRRHKRASMWLVRPLAHGTTDDGQPFLVIPWHQHSLATWLNQSPAPDLLQRLIALEQAATAVVALHRSGADHATVPLHRDLKPDNFLVDDADGSLRVVMADLGTYKARNPLVVAQQTGVSTEGFAPLEQFLPIARAADPSVDVHALAVLVYVALVGSTPQATRTRATCTTPLADELIRLDAKGAHRTDAEDARFQRLRRAALSDLVELDQAALLELDRNRLADACEALCVEIAANVQGLSEELVSHLLPPIEKALRVDPDRRSERANLLLAALTACRQRLTALQPPPAPRPSDGGTGPSRTRPAVVLGALVGLGGSLLLGAALLSWPVQPKAANEAERSEVWPAGMPREPASSRMGEPATTRAAEADDALEVEAATLAIAAPATVARTNGSITAADTPAQHTNVSNTPRDLQARNDGVELPDLPEPAVEDLSVDVTAPAIQPPPPCRITFDYWPDMGATVSTGNRSAVKSLTMDVADERRVVLVQEGLSPDSRQYVIALRQDGNAWRGRVATPEGSGLAVSCHPGSSVTVRVNKQGGLELH